MFRILKSSSAPSKEAAAAAATEAAVAGLCPAADAAGSPVVKGEKKTKSKTKNKKNKEAQPASKNTEKSTKLDKTQDKNNKFIDVVGDNNEDDDDDEDNDDDDDDGYEKGKKICLPEEECDLPTFLHTKNCDPKLIEETRKLLTKRYAKNPQSFYDDDYKLMLKDDWTVTRFLLRRRLHPKRTAKLMEECGKFRKHYRMSDLKLNEFPLEFLVPGGLFHYAPDRVGNTTVYMRIKMYRRAPEVTELFKSFMLCVLEESDKANGGRGSAVIFDLTGCGLQNVDLSFLSWLLSCFRNYCPKGVGYIMVYNLPWMLNATCKLAMTWMSSSNRRALRFVQGDEIENFIAKENLPDYLGGTCKIDYKAAPIGAKYAAECGDRLNLSQEQVNKLESLFKECMENEN